MQLSSVFFRSDLNYLSHFSELYICIKHGAYHIYDCVEVLKSLSEFDQKQKFCDGSLEDINLSTNRIFLHLPNIFGELLEIAEVFSSNRNMLIKKRTC